MKQRAGKAVMVGFELGTGKPVEIPLAHTFVCGQTQLSGKTTTLRAIVMRSGRRALAFVTKRGEEFEGRRIRPFLPREGDRPIHWRLVETILASALGQRSMKYERFQIMNAAKGARSLEDVRRNCDKLRLKAKGNAGEMYEMIGEYLDLVLPEMRALNAADALDLQPGLNVIDVAGHSQQLQAMVIRACLEQINLHEEQVLTVFPEAWEFAPRGRKTPASDEAVAMARKGAVLENLLLCDSQDIAGVDTTIRQAASVWILGVQRELNELKRTLQMIPAGIKRPKPADVTSLKLGQFIVCHGDQAIRTYVQPAWMDEADAHAIAMGKLSHNEIWKPPPPSIEVEIDDGARMQGIIDLDRELQTQYGNHPQPENDEMAKEDVDRLEQTITRGFESLTRHLSKPRAKSSEAGSNAEPCSISNEELYQFIKRRLQEDAPALLKLTAAVPEIQIFEELKTINTSTEGKGKLMGRLAMMIADGFFDDGKSKDAIREHLKRFGLVAQKTYADITFSNNMSDLVEWGFLFVENGGYVANPRMKKHVKRV